MSHTDPEILALRALGETAGTAHDAEHAASCALCRAELARLTEVVQLARNAGPGEALEPPPPQLWNRIAAAAGVSAQLNGSALNGSAPNSRPALDSPALDSSAPNSPTLDGLALISPALEGPALDSATLNGSAPPAEPPPAEPPAVPVVPAAPVASEGGSRSPRPRPAFWPRGRLAGALAGLAAGLIIGIGGAAGVAQLVKAPPARVIAQVELSPLPQFPQWQGTTGTAVMRATASQQQIVVTLRAPARPGFYEVWLLARDGVSMISLGDLNADHTGTFVVPPGVDLRDYSRIDISLQPFDGNTQHAKASVVRGSLPATALGAGPAARS